MSRLIQFYPNHCKYSKFCLGSKSEITIPSTTFYVNDKIRYIPECKVRCVLEYLIYAQECIYGLLPNAISVLNMQQGERNWTIFLNAILRASESNIARRTSNEIETAYRNDAVASLFNVDELASIGITNIAAYNKFEFRKLEPAIIAYANTIKFTQIPKLRKLLLNTGDAILLYMSKYDKLYGTGYSPNDMRVIRFGTGEQQNLLGKMLTRIRDSLLKTAL